ncbi:unnamed protein product, partial [Rotaria sp. Silwood2]
SELHHGGTIRHRNHSIHELYDKNAQAGGNTASTNNILYNYGGRVLTGTTKVYLLFYGTWTSTQINIIRTFVSTVGTTNWFNIEKTYYYQAASGSSIVNTAGPLTLGGAWTLDYIYGTQLTGTNIPDAFSNYISQGQLPDDPNGIYLWLSSADVSESNSWGESFLQNYCGYHSTFPIESTQYIYGFIGNPKTTYGCNPYFQTVSPNSELGVDAMVSVIAHEIVEAMSDSLGNAWYDSTGDENGDKW